VIGNESEYGNKYEDAWDAEHVKLPASRKNCFKDFETQKLLPKWPVIVKALTADIKSIEDLRLAMMQYNQSYYDSWDFVALEVFVEKILSPEDSQKFFSTTVRPPFPSLSLYLLNLKSPAIEPNERKKKEEKKLTN
jgi:hypothetical protein